MSRHIHTQTPYTPSLPRCEYVPRRAPGSHGLTDAVPQSLLPTEMAPLQPHWQQPSHPAVQEVIINEAEFTSKSLSRVALPPFGLFAKMAFPPCTAADEPTYATVQMAKDRHLNLNSDLLYINHSCEPSLVRLHFSLVPILGHPSLPHPACQPLPPPG